MIETLLIFLATAFASDAIQRQGGGWQQPPRETDDEYKARLEALYAQVRTQYLPEVLTRGKIAEAVWRAAEQQLEADTEIETWQDDEEIIETPELKYLRALPRRSEWGDYIVRSSGKGTEWTQNRELVKWDAMMQAGEVPPDQPLPPGMEWKDFPTWDFKRARSRQDPEVGWKKHMGYSIANPDAASGAPDHLFLFMFGEDGPVLAAWDEIGISDALEEAVAFAVDDLGWDLLVEGEDDWEGEVIETESGPIRNNVYSLFTIDNPWPGRSHTRTNVGQARPSGTIWNSPMDPVEALEMWMAYQIRSRRDD